MLFSNLLVAIALTTLWPLGMLGVLAGCAWLERRTLIPEEIVPRRFERMDRKPPEAVEAMVLEETAQVVAAYWSSTGRQLPTGAPPPNGEASRTASVPARANGRLPAAANGQPADWAAPGRARSAMRRRPSRGRHERR